MDVKYKELGLFIPTLFDMKDMWDINKSRCGGYFNWLFFWMYPLAGVCLISFTLLCYIELKVKERKV